MDRLGTPKAAAGLVKRCMIVAAPRWVALTMAACIVGCASSAQPAPQLAVASGTQATSVELPSGPIGTSDQARAVLEAVEQHRARLEQRWSARDQQCRTRFLVTPCLEDLRRDRLQTEDALGRIETSARARLRLDDAIARNASEASRLADDTTEQRDRESERRQSAQQREQRELQVQQRAQQRAGDDAARAAIAERSAARTRSKQAELEARAQRAAKREAEAPANRAEYERKQQEAQRRQQERLERDARRAHAQSAGPAAPPTAPTAPAR